MARRGNQLGVEGWATVADALERVTCLTSLNGCNKYAAIRAGRLRELNLDNTELGVWAARFLERSASTLTKLDIRCARRAHPSPEAAARGWAGRYAGRWGWGVVRGHDSEM